MTTQPRYVALTEDHTTVAGPTKGTFYQNGDSFVFFAETKVFDADFYIVNGPNDAKIWLPAVILERIDRVPWLLEVACAV